MPQVVVAALVKIGTVIVSAVGESLVVESHSKYETAVTTTEL